MNPDSVKLSQFRPVTLFKPDYKICGCEAEKVSGCFLINDRPKCSECIIHRSQRSHYSTQHNRSRKCSQINTMLSGIPAETSDPSRIPSERLHHPSERERERLVRWYFISLKATGALCSGILNPANNLVPRVPVWALHLNCKCLDLPADSSGSVSDSLRKVNQQRGLICGCTLNRFVVYQQLHRSGSRPIDCYVCFQRRPVNQTQHNTTENRTLTIHSLSNVNRRNLDVWLSLSVFSTVSSHIFTFSTSLYSS